MSPTEALRIVKDAMTVIVDAVVGENSNPSESFQSKYDKLDAVTTDVTKTLYSLDIGADYTEKYRSAAWISERIRDFYINNSPSPLAGVVKPERWMFEMQDKE